MQELNIKKGSGAPGKNSAGKISLSQIENVAKKKIADMNASSITSCIEMVKGSAISMGLDIIDG